MSNIRRMKLRTARRRPWYFWLGKYGLPIIQSVISGLAIAFLATFMLEGRIAAIKARIDIEAEEQKKFDELSLSASKEVYSACIGALLVNAKLTPQTKTEADSALQEFNAVLLKHLSYLPEDVKVTYLMLLRNIRKVTELATQQQDFKSMKEYETLKDPEARKAIKRHNTEISLCIQQIVEHNELWQAGGRTEADAQLKRFNENDGRTDVSKEALKESGNQP